MKPISPKEALKNKKNVIPDKVIEIINNLITTKYDGKNEFPIQIQEVKKLFVKEFGPDYKDSWLDFEPLYEDSGWDIHIDSPGYNESFYEPCYVFKPKSSRQQANFW